VPTEDKDAGAHDAASRDARPDGPAGSPGGASPGPAPGGPQGGAADWGGEWEAEWEKVASAWGAAAHLALDAATYGPDLPTDAELRLLGELRGRRVLELGCGGAHGSVVFAKAGAVAIGVDPSAERLAATRRLAEAEEVRVELHRGNLADLAFLRADSVDVVFSAWALGYCTDLRRVFRQVHRVLRPGGPFVFSLPHPASFLVDPEEQAPVVRRPYFAREPVERRSGAATFRVPARTLSELYMDLVRSGYRVDALAEPELVRTGPRTPLYREAFRLVPLALVVRARKEGA
jgi:SAM-dependent methyltransferase